MNSYLLSDKLRIHPVIKVILILLFAVGSGYLTYKFGFVTLGGLLGLVAVIVFFTVLFIEPKISLYIALTLGFVMPILGRYVYGAIPYGFVAESCIVLTYLGLFFKHFKKLDFRPAANELVFLMAVWMGYIILQLGNPQAHSYAAWFYAMRGFALIPMMLIPLGFITFNSKKDWKNFFTLWVVLSVLGMLWAFKQAYIGLDSAELHWLYDEGHAKTHVLFGKIRYWSFYIDASTFAAAMGQLCIICLIMFLGPYNRRKKIFYIVISMLSFYTLMLSGSRGALAVPAVGAMVYIVMIKSHKYVILTLCILVAGFVFLKFTSIGEQNYNIHRLRTALNPNDASFQVRMINRARLDNYLKDKPFGGGVGASGAFGLRFNPNTWLGHFPTDGLYVHIKADTGIVGQVLYVGIWLYILFRCIKIAWEIENPEHKNIVMALTAGFAGMLVASYTNDLLTQYPNSLMTYLSLSFVYCIKHWNDKGEFVLKKNT